MIAIPPEIYEKQRDCITLCIDIMEVCGVKLLHTIDKTIKYRTSVWLTSKKHEDVFDALDVALQQYNSALFKIKFIKCDPEFQAMLKPIQDTMSLTLVPVNTNNHVPEIERSIETIKEWTRATFHHLPYKTIPRVMCEHIVLKSTMMANMYPPKGGISDTYSPHMIMQRQKLDYSKHFQFTFGEFVLSHVENSPTNGMEARGVDSIYLRPCYDSHKGGHYTINLHTGKVLNPFKCTAVPPTATHIRAVEAMAKSQGITEFKFTGKYGDNLRHIDWTARVDYPNDVDDDDNNDNNNNLDAGSDKGYNEENNDDYSESNDSESDSYHEY